MLFPSMLLTGLCNKSICYAQRPCHPIPFFLVNSIPMLLRRQHSQGRVQSQEMNHDFSQSLTVLPSLDPCQKVVCTQACYSLLSRQVKSARSFWLKYSSPPKKERYRALTPLSSKSALELPVSELLFMWHYKALLPKCHLICYTITCSPKYLNLYPLADLLPILQGHCPKYVHATVPEKVKVLVTQSCPTLCDPMDCSPPSSSVHGNLQTRTFTLTKLLLTGTWVFSLSFLFKLYWYKWKYN